MKSIAKILSNLLHPFLIPIYVEALLLFSGSIYTLYPMRLKVYLIWAVGLYSAVLPLLTMALLKRIQRLRGREIQRRHKMTIMMFVCAVCYLLFAITMMRAPSLIIFRKMASSALLCTMFCIILSRFTRSSSRLLDSAVDTSCGRSVGLDKVVSRSQPQPAVAGKFCGRISTYYLIDVISIKCNDS